MYVTKSSADVEIARHASRWTRIRLVSNAISGTSASHRRPQTVRFDSPMWFPISVLYRSNTYLAPFLRLLPSKCKPPHFPKSKKKPIYWTGWSFYLLSTTSLWQKELFALKNIAYERFCKTSKSATVCAWSLLLVNIYYNDEDVSILSPSPTPRARAGGVNWVGDRLHESS